MLHADEVIAFAPSADLRQARAFYEQVLGLRVTEQNDFACVFDANGTMLRVTAVAEVARPGYTVLGWRVADDPGRRQGGMVRRPRRERPVAHSVRLAPSSPSIRFAWHPGRLTSGARYPVDGAPARVDAGRCDRDR